MADDTKISSNSYFPKLVAITNFKPFTRNANIHSGCLYDTNHLMDTLTIKMKLNATHLDYLIKNIAWTKS